MRHRLRSSTTQALVEVSQLGGDGIEPVAVRRLELSEYSCEESVRVGQSLLQGPESRESH
jgi:hypothetical protein